MCCLLMDIMCDFDKICWVAGGYIDGSELGVDFVFAILD